MRKGLIYIIVLGVMPLLGQNYYGKAHPIRPLKEEFGYPKNQLLLQVKEKKDSANIGYNVIYFINSTNEEVVVQSYMGQIYPICRIYKEEGEWLSLERRGWCGTGYGKSVIPANHYAWTRIDTTKGVYKTKVKYRLMVNDTAVFSPVFTAYIYKPDRFGAYGLAIQEYEVELERAIDARKKASYLVRIGQMFMRLKEYELALTKFEAAILLDSENNDARYWKGVSYINQVSKCAPFDKHLQQGVISAAFAEWDFIPRNTKIFENIQNRRAVYLPELLTKKEWEADNNLPFKITEDGNKLYYIDCLVKDYIKIMYKK